MIRLNFKTLLAKKEQSENRRIHYGEISQKTGISRQTLSRIAQRRQKNLKLDTVARICDYFACEIQDFVEFLRK
jgi:putative transcriptional regulator